MFSESPWHIMSFLRKLDRFGLPIPAFNVRGASEVKTAFGGVLTIAIIIVTLGYFALKFQDLRTGKDK